MRSHQIFWQARKSLSETVRFPDKAFFGKFCLAENLASIFWVKDERLFFWRAVLKQKTFSENQER